MADKKVEAKKADAKKADAKKPAKKNKQNVFQSFLSTSVRARVNSRKLLGLHQSRLQRTSVLLSA